MCNVSHSTPLLKLAISLNHRGCWWLLWYCFYLWFTVCPEFSQVILTLSSTKLARGLFLAPAVFFLPSALFLLVIWVSTSKYVYGFHSMQFPSLLLTSSINSPFIFLIHPKQLLISSTTLPSKGMALIGYVATEYFKRITAFGFHTY